MKQNLLKPVVSEPGIFARLRTGSMLHLTKFAGVRLSLAVKSSIFAATVRTLCFVSIIESLQE